MEWTDQELRELATFLARRMTTRLELIDPADPPAAGDPIGQWCNELKAAHDSGRLAVLSRRVSAVAPEDENLQKVCDLLADSGGRKALQVMGAALSVGLFAVVAGGAWMMAAPEAAALQPQSVTMARADVQTPIRAASIQVPRETALSAAVLEVVSASIDDASAQPEAQPEIAAPAPPPVVAATVAPAPGCVTKPGAIVGYWYAGDSPPGAAGDVITMGHAVNVRTAFPQDANGYDSRSAVACILEEGDRVTLSKAPMRIAGGAWWVPLVTGDRATAEG
jgi:hypothetical protein